jgi:hypothetical protein
VVSGFYLRVMLLCMYCVAWQLTSAKAYLPSIACVWGRTHTPRSSDESMATGNGAINMAIIEAAAAAKVGRCVYVSVSDAVRDAVGTFALKGYFKGEVSNLCARRRCQRLVTCRKGAL